MKETMVWVTNLLKELNKNFPDDKAKPTITLPIEHKDVVLIVCSFVSGGSWYSFGVVEDDLNLSPEELVSQVKDDLKL